MIITRWLVAAGAVALLVLRSWFWRRPSAGLQADDEAAPEQEALLPPSSADGGTVPEDAASSGAPSQMRELSQACIGGQLPDTAALVAPDDVDLALADPNLADAGSEPSGQIAPAAVPCSTGSMAAVAPAPWAPQLPPAAPAPIDEPYLQSLLDQELGPPKFAVRKSYEEPAAAQPPDMLSLEELLDKEFGPPKFPVPKPASPSGTTQLELAAQGSGSSSGAGPAAAHVGAGVKRSAQEQDTSPRGAPCRPSVLTLSITHGPAAGKQFVADDPLTEYKIGRLPDCALQVLDQEISGRHASVRWDAGVQRWKLHDVGSLNGTSINGTAIGKDYKVPGEEVALSDGDALELGSVTRMGVALAAAPSRQQRAQREHADATAPKRHHAATSGPRGATLPPDDPGAATNRSPWDCMATSVSAAGMQGLPQPAALQDLPALGARLCVHNRLGVDHKRLNQGCEDVPYWELPYGPYDRSGVLCVFDGHHGSKAAHQATEHVPAILRAKLLLRDGRQPPPLPPPPPPPQRPSKAEVEEEEEGLVGGLEEGDEEAEAAEGLEEAGVRKEAAAEPAGSKEEGEPAGASSGGGGAGGAAENGGGGGAGAAGPAASAGGSTAAAAGASAGSGGAATTAGGAAEAASALAAEEAAAAAPVELLPPPPAGPPLPPLLRGREVGSQRALLKETFLAADQHMSMEEGCTATLVLLEHEAAGGWLMQSANVGDSSAVLVNLTRGTWAKLSEDHRISSSVSERKRLAERGHTVRNRLYGLNISRMLGDRFLKEEDLGFLAEPYVSPTAEVGPGECALLVVASDGLWDALSEERAAKMVLQEAAKAAVSPRHGAAAPPLGCQAVADLLLAQALLLRSKDDITVAVLELGPHLRAGAGAGAAGSSGR